MKTANDIGGGWFTLSDPIFPYQDAMSFGRLLIVRKDDETERSTAVYGAYPEGDDWAVHPSPIFRTTLLIEPASALAALGYTLA